LSVLRSVFRPVARSALRSGPADALPSSDGPSSASSAASPAACAAPGFFLPRPPRLPRRRLFLGPSGASCDSVGSGAWVSGGVCTSMATASRAVASPSPSSSGPRAHRATPWAPVPGSQAESVPLWQRLLEPWPLPLRPSCQSETSVVPRLSSPLSIARGPRKATGVSGLALRGFKTSVDMTCRNGSSRGFGRLFGQRSAPRSGGRRAKSSATCADCAQTLRKARPGPRLDLRIPRPALAARRLQVLEPRIRFFELQQLFGQLRVRHRPSHRLGRGAS